MKMYTATIPASALNVRSRESYYARQKRLFFLVIILVPIIPLLFISWTASRFYQQSWMDKTTVELTSLANSRREIIDLFLDNQENTLAGYAELYDFAWLNTPGNIEKLFKAMNHHGVIVDLGLIAQDGSHRSYTGPFAEDLKDKNYAKTHWFAEVMQNGRYISDVFTGYRGVPHIIVAVTDPSRSWVLRATINSELFNSLLANTEVGPGGDAFILNQQGVLQTPSRLGLTALPLGEEGLLATGGALTIHHSQDALYASTGMKNNTWTLVLKTDIATSLADFYRARQRDRLIIAGAALLILTVSNFLVRSMMNKIESADQQRMVLYDRIRNSEKMALVGRMAANVAHEINNPLQIIGDQAGWVDELLDDEDPAQLKNTDEYRAAFAKIRTQVKRASTITHRLLGFSRSTDGLKSKININTLVEETVSFLEKEATNHRIAIRRNLNPDLPEIVTDTTQLQQVFLNILNNAIDAIGNGGAVTISSSLSEEQLAVEFADSGPGLSEEALKKVFDPFFTTKKAGSGTGIGLSISYSIIERLGGRIEVRNGRQGGCIFRVTLPVAP
ncbi:MAG: two-component sensor histidine kinase [Proteobacteria bacterium]|nr:two-component sensor histidine kinase [Pseudomonadota bacterium]